MRNETCTSVSIPAGPSVPFNRTLPPALTLTDSLQFKLKYYIICNMQLWENVQGSLDLFLYQLNSLTSSFLMTGKGLRDAEMTADTLMLYLCVC